MTHPATKYTLPNESDREAYAALRPIAVALVDTREITDVRRRESLIDAVACLGWQTVIHPNGMEEDTGESEAQRNIADLCCEEIAARTEAGLYFTDNEPGWADDTMDFLVGEMSDAVLAILNAYGRHRGVTEWGF